MSHEFERDDPLGRAVAALQQPVPIAPGMAVRVGVRRSKRRRNRVALIVALVVSVGIPLVAMHRGVSGTAVTFAIAAPSVRSVSLVGDFTDWRSDRVQLVQASSGQWRTTVTLRPGRYRFAYLVDHAQWRADAAAASAPDDFGRPTSVLTVAGN